jgi:hypothetical protein
MRLPLTVWAELVEALLIFLRKEKPFASEQGRASLN